MTLLSLADSCRQLGIDPKTLRRWLASAPFTVPHPHAAPRQGLTEEQLCWLAQAHHRSLPMLVQAPPQPAPVPSAESAPLSEDLCEVLVALRALPAQLAALHEQLADLTHQLSHFAEPAATTGSRAGATPKATKSRRGGRGQVVNRRQSQPSSAQVLALVE